MNGDLDARSAFLNWKVLRRPICVILWLAAEKVEYEIDPPGKA